LLQPPSVDLIDRLLTLLQLWVTDSWPTLEARRVASLNALWMRLMQSLSGTQISWLVDCQAEMTRLRRTPDAGMPPSESLNKRLHELVDAGIEEQFLVIAVREAMARLISVSLPDGLDKWYVLADGALPLTFQFGTRNLPEKPSSTYTYDDNPPKL
jgi:hypothetical protein